MCGGVIVDMQKDNHTNISLPSAGTPLYWQKAYNTNLIHLNTSHLYYLYLSLVMSSQLLLPLQDQVILRPTFSRPIRLGVGPLLEQMTRFYISLSDNYFLLHVGRPLWQEDGSVVCSAIMQVQVKLYCDRQLVGQFVLVWGPMWGSWPDFTFLCLTIAFFFI
jgi:hypothetical protein